MEVYILCRLYQRHIALDIQPFVQMVLGNFLVIFLIYFQLFDCLVVLKHIKLIRLLTNNIDLPFSLDKPNWTNDTIMNCTFNENINAGNINYDINVIKSVQIIKQYKNKKIKDDFVVFNKNISEETDLYFETDEVVDHSPVSSV